MRGPAVRPIVIAAGGTGGHFFPAEALAAKLIERGHRIVLMTDTRSGAMNSPVFTGHEQYILRGAGIAGRGVGRAARAVLSLAAGTVQARGILLRLDAAAVVGFGGYPSVAPVLAARMLRRRPRIVLHEQNAVLGRANRFLARRGDLLALGFANTERVPAGVATQVVGSPVRPAIEALAGASAIAMDKRIDLLVLGGSLGARIFSSVVPDAIKMLPADLRARLHIVQQCRAEDLEQVHAAYKSTGVDAETAVFFTDVADRLKVAHLVISRAGASTCAEIAVVGRASILVPLPGAIDGHQTANARALSGAIVIRQDDFTPARLSVNLIKLFSNPDSLSAAAHLAAGCGRPTATVDLADAVERLIANVDASH